jgi:hypothetical protein
VDLVTKEGSEADVERTDTIPIVAAGVVGEAMTCLVLADEMLAKFGRDHVEELRATCTATAPRWPASENGKKKRAMAGAIALEVGRRVLPSGRWATRPPTRTPAPARDPPEWPAVGIL